MRCVCRARASPIEGGGRSGARRDTVHREEGVVVVRVLFIRIAMDYRPIQMQTTFDASAP